MSCLLLVNIKSLCQSTVKSFVWLVFRIIYPIKNDYDSIAEVSLFPLCAEGMEYEDLSNSCI